MKLTHYELEIFEDVINGDLEPKKLYADNLKNAIGYLEDEVEKCEITIFGIFKSKNKELQLVEQIRLSNTHPLEYQYINQDTLHKTEDILEQIPREALNNLQVNPSQTKAVYIKEQHSKRLIGFKKATEWQKLDEYHIKYSFFHVMLSKHVKEIKRKISIEFYKLDDHELEKYVNRTHNKLINYCIDAIEKYELSIEDLDFKAKKKYSDMDCMALVYRHINQIVNFLYNEYGAYLHPDANIPYNAHILNRNNLQSLAKTTYNKIKALKIHKDLKDALMETVNKLLNINIGD